MALSQPEIDALKADLAALNTAIRSGVRSVTLGGQTVIYNTTDSLIKARNDVQASLNAAVVDTPRSRQSYAVYSGRGYD